MVTQPALLDAAGLVKRFGRRRVLDGASLAIGTAEVVGVCGENGSGKTTLIRILAGMLRPDAGEVRRTARIGYAPQVPLLYDHLTAWEHFRYTAAARGLTDGRWRRGARALLERYDFAAWGDAPSATLSEGTRQKLNLALALLADPEVLLLDEPYGGFEWRTYLRFWDHVAELRAHGRGLVVVSHLFHDRERFDRLLELRGGRLQEAAR